MLRVVEGPKYCFPYISGATTSDHWSRRPLFPQMLFKIRPVVRRPEDGAGASWSIQGRVGSKVDGQSSGRRRHSPKAASVASGLSGDVNCGVRVSLRRLLCGRSPLLALSLSPGCSYLEESLFPHSSAYFDPGQALRTTFDPSSLSPPNPYPPPAFGNSKAKRPDPSDQRQHTLPIAPQLHFWGMKTTA